MTRAGTRSTQPSELEQLKAKLADVASERDRLLMALAEEREAHNALRVALRSSVIPSHPDADLGDAAPPLRHVVVDWLNVGVKCFLGPVHSVSRMLVSRALKLRGRGTL